MNSKESSVVPRGFSRYLVLSFLKEGPMTGKEIMDKAEKSSGGVWRPSPGLVYPLLGRLHDHGLIEEVEGKFTITSKGEKALDDYVKKEAEIRAKMDAVKKLSHHIFATGRFLAEEALEELVMVASGIRLYLAELSGKKRREFLIRYKAHLEKELRRIEEDLEKETSQ